MREVALAAACLCACASVCGVASAGSRWSTSSLSMRGWQWAGDSTIAVGGVASKAVAVKALSVLSLCGGLDDVVSDAINPRVWSR